MLIEVEPFRAADLAEMVMAERDLARLKLAGSLEALGHVFETRGPSWTLRIDDLIIGSGGVTILWPGVGEAWILQSIFAGQYPLASFRAIREGLKAGIRSHGLRRIQSVVHHSIPRDQRWVVRLGFDFEGIMSRYGPEGDTYLRYALLPQEGEDG